MACCGCGRRPADVARGHGAGDRYCEGRDQDSGDPAVISEWNEIAQTTLLANTAERTTEQTDTALFYSGNPLIQFNAALRDQVIVQQLDIVDAARMFAAVDMSLANGVISIWYSKHIYGFWRPVTAIHLADADGNPATTADPDWWHFGPLLPIRST